MSKKYTTDNITISASLNDGSGVGTSGQVLSSTGSGVSWIDGSGIVGGPYLALTGGTLTGDVMFTGATHHAMWDKSASALEFWDNAKLTFGDPGGTPDLQIYHDGSNSYIDDSGTGDLYIRANNLRLSNADGSGQTINANNGGNVELFHNNSKKLETTSTGVAVTGNLDSPQISVNDYISHNGDSNTYFGFPTADTINLTTAGAERMRITSAGNVGIGVTAPLANLDISNDAGSTYQQWSYDNPGANNYNLTLSETVTAGNVRFVFDQKNAGTQYSDVLVFNQGEIGIGTDEPQSKLQVDGGIQMADDTDTASASKVGTQRYRTSGNNSYVDMCMQTGATTYEWVNILENNW